MQGESRGSDPILVQASGAEVSYPAAEYEGASYSGVRVSRQSRNDTAPSVYFRYRVIKRLMDICVAILASILLLPVILVIMALVNFTSPGPIFFSHRRIAKDGAFFSMWKFRTMCVDSTEVLDHYLAQHPEARAEWSLTHKLKQDPRITSVGNVLRRYSLDELPQIWNVLTGRMSIVGPRPIVAAEVEKYGEFFDHYTRVKPGVTGLWQVSGRSKVSYPNRVKLDCEYVEQWTLFRDFKILLATAKSVVNQDGAY